MNKKIYYVDLPNYQNPGMEWENVDIFDTKEEAVAWIREHIDPNCDESGKVGLVSEGEELDIDSFEDELDVPTGEDPDGTIDLGLAPWQH